MAKIEDGRSHTTRSYLGGTFGVSNTSDNVQKKREGLSGYASSRSMSESKQPYNYKGQSETKHISNVVNRHSDYLAECQEATGMKHNKNPQPNLPVRDQIDELRRKMHEEAQLRLLSYEKRNERRRLREVRKVEEAKSEEKRQSGTLHEYQAELDTGVSLRRIPHELSNSTREINRSSSLRMSNSFQQDVKRTCDFSLDLMPHDKRIDPSDVLFKQVHSKVNTFIKQSPRHSSNATCDSFCNEKTIDSYAKEFESNHIRQSKEQSSFTGERRYSTYGSRMGNKEEYNRRQPLIDIKRTDWNKRDMSILHGATPKKYRILKLYNNKKYATGDNSSVLSHASCGNQQVKLRVAQKHQINRMESNAGVNRTSLTYPHPLRDTPLPKNSKKHISRSSVDDTVKSPQTGEDETESNLRNGYRLPGHIKFQTQRLDEQEVLFSDVSSTVIKPHEMKILPACGRSVKHNTPKEQDIFTDVAPEHVNNVGMVCSEFRPNCNYYSPIRDRTTHDVRRPLFSPCQHAVSVSSMSLPPTHNLAHTMSPDQTSRKSPNRTYTNAFNCRHSSDSAQVYNLQAAHTISQAQTRGVFNSSLDEVEAKFQEECPDNILSPMTEDGEENQLPLKTISNNHISALNAQLELRISQDQNDKKRSNRNEHSPSHTNKQPPGFLNPQKILFPKRFIRKDLFVPSSCAQTFIDPMTTIEGNVAEQPGEPSKPIATNPHSIKRLDTIYNTESAGSYFRDAFDRGTRLDYDAPPGTHLDRREIEHFASVDDQTQDYDSKSHCLRGQYNNRLSYSNSPPQPNDPSRLLLRQLAAHQ